MPIFNFPIIIPQPPQSQRPACPCWAPLVPQIYAFCDPRKPMTCQPPICCQPQPGPVRPPVGTRPPPRPPARPPAPPPRPPMRPGGGGPGGPGRPRAVDAEPYGEAESYNSSEEV